MSDERCFCGAGDWEGADGTFYIQCHAPDCLWLAWCVTLKRDGICAGCGYPFKIKSGEGWRTLSCRRCETFSTEMW